jgi:hypothetical protein
VELEVKSGLVHKQARILARIVHERHRSRPVPYNPAMNSLAREPSPYLQQHATNPVDWRPWNTEALEQARREDKPILLSIGYAACHWCHVMAHESFENEATAAVMNRHFVNIKVDREERPDLDRIYQIAHQMLAQRGGGWPLTMFLTPDDHIPFFGGTYFPDKPRHGMPAFTDILQRVAAYYREHRNDIRQQNQALAEAFTTLNPPPSTGQRTDEPLRKARAMLADEFDDRGGGFGAAPKFPHPAMLEHLLRHWRYSGGQPDLHALYMATLTLRRMAEGGLFDQLGGGFYRYSVDQHWAIPHFEKMLYDNGALLAAYAQAAVATGDGFHARIAQQTADWALREMRAPGGGFYSSLDADSEGHEGRFYVWDRDEVRALLTPREYDLFERRYGLARVANFEGRWHLQVFEPLQELARGSAVAEVEATLETARAKLLSARERRVRPARDEKILTTWNAIMIRGLAIAARALDRPDYAGAATQALDFIRTHLWRDGRLLVTSTGGQAHLPAYLDDHALLADAILELQQCRWRSDEFAFAVQLVEVLLRHFADGQNGGFYFTADDHETLIHRSRAFGDDAIPSGNAVAARVLNRLGLLLGEPRYLQAAERTVKAGWAPLQRYPQGHASLLTALDEQLHPPATVIIRGSTRDLPVWQQLLARSYDPRRMALPIPADAEALPPALAEKSAGGGTRAWICRGTHCLAPVESLQGLMQALEDDAALPGGGGS